MARIEPCILTNMCMICDGDRILVQDRNDPVGRFRSVRIMGWLYAGNYPK